MADYPMILKTSGRRCVVVGAGPVASRKIGSLLQADADVLVVAPAAVPEISEHARRGRLVWRRMVYEPACLDGAFLAFAASSDSDVNRAVAADAKRRRILVNVADDPDACDFAVPAVARGTEWTAAVSTGGASPAVARRMREQLEAEWAGWLDEFIGWLGCARREGTIPGATQRRRAAAVARALDCGALEALRAGDRSRARELFAAALAGSGDR